MKTILYAGTITGGSPHDSWEHKSPIFASPERVTEWLLAENLRKVTEGVWGPQWTCVIEAQELFSEERYELLRMVVHTREKLSIVIDVAAWRRRLQETGLRF